MCCMIFKILFRKLRYSPCERPKARVNPVLSSEGAGVRQLEAHKAPWARDPGPLPCLAGHTMHTVCLPPVYVPVFPFHTIHEGRDFCCIHCCAVRTYNRA